MCRCTRNPQVPSVRYVDARAISVVDKGSCLPPQQVMQVVTNGEIKTMKPKNREIEGCARFCREALKRCLLLQHMLQVHAIHHECPLYTWPRTRKPTFVLHLTPSPAGPIIVKNLSPSKYNPQWNFSRRLFQRYLWKET